MNRCELHFRTPTVTPLMKKYQYRNILESAEGTFEGVSNPFPIP